MSRHSGPHVRLPPDDQRCEALVTGQPSFHWEWMRVDHRCHRKANQTRGVGDRIIAVCYQHATSREIVAHDDTSAVS